MCLLPAGDVKSLLVSLESFFHRDLLSSSASSFVDAKGATLLPVGIDGISLLAPTVRALSHHDIRPWLFPALAFIFNFCRASRALYEKRIASLAHTMLECWGEAYLHFERDSFEI